MRFYLGTDHASWLWKEPPPYPLFISRRVLEPYRTLKRAQTRWALDSGGFTELNMFGEWRTTPYEYVAKVQRYMDEIGSLDWAAPQDWMCEPNVLAKTGLTVLEHQRRTVRNYLDLRTLSPQLPIIPALQGWEPDDYLRHRDMYDRAGIDLTAVPLVGMGTFCRRANLRPVHDLVHRLASDGISMHGFGVKRDGLPVMGPDLASADSLAWSLGARLAPGNLCGVSHKAKKCSHCRRWATMWADRVVASIGTEPLQLSIARYV